MTKIKVYFVLPAYCNSDENSTSEPMRRAFEVSTNKIIKQQSFKILTKFIFAVVLPKPINPRMDQREELFSSKFR